MTNKPTEKVLFFDTTLRDGEQSPGAALSVSEKLKIAHQLAKLGVDIIEAGFPVSSPAQFEATRLCAEQIQGPVICALARANEKDITAAGQAIQPAAKRRIHVFIATSPIHMEYKLRKKPEQVLKMAVEAVKMARQFTDDVEFSPEDACRSEMQFLYEILAAVIEAGATTLNIPDTVGYVLPCEYGQIITNIKQNVKGIEGVIISTHCHDDLGMATANTLAGVKSGARQVECTINGIGERAGNAALEEIVMAIHTRQDFFENLSTGIDTRQIYRTSQLVSQLTGFVIQPNKAIVGRNAFAHESGIHVDGILKKRETYEIMTPQMIGLESSRVVLGRHSGRHAFLDRCKQIGYDLAENEIENAYQKFLELADRKKEIFDEDIAAIINNEVRSVEKMFDLNYLLVACGTGTLPTASVRVRVRDQIRQAAAYGDGPVDAAYEAIRQAVGKAPKLISYSIRAITEGKDALGETTVRIENEQGRRFIGRGVSTDIIEASAKAYVDAINRMAAAETNGSAEQPKATI
ncbi:MAG TPA: 2-isopropylmalate synthase [Anaerohalosphaeraceae bacterium]|mgnify:CR=1 FL=1|nr:2-isopropylmalate synthase [Anaerohalosphaeraceae bacterium]HPB93791.1 2-isopropylmalate synthase [Anaerohalosphaeraceae bacterium]HRT24202.1 2-isopropylmalate synthase [Anaerohalosphaeraceae bacterium]